MEPLTHCILNSNSAVRILSVTKWILITINLPDFPVVHEKNLVRFASETFLIIHPVFDAHTGNPHFGRHSSPALTARCKHQPTPLIIN